MEALYNAVEVEAIKSGIGNIESFGLSCREILIKSVSWLKEQYERTEDLRYLQKAVWHMYAYLELGFSYESGEQEFHPILDYLELNAEELFPRKKWRRKEIPLTKMAVSQLLGKWNPSLHSMKISDAVKDIIDKAANRKEGEYVYHCGKIIRQEGGELLWEKTFKLYVNGGSAILHNINENQYYILAQTSGGKTYDKDSDCRG